MSRHLEQHLASARGYNALFLAAGALEEACEAAPEALTPKGVDLILGSLNDRSFESRKTALFFYRRLADILTTTSRSLGPEHPITHQAMDGIIQAIGSSTGYRHLAMCAAAGNLVSKETAFQSLPDETTPPAPMALQELIKLAEFPKEAIHTHEINGRSLSFCHGTQRLVIKCARVSEDPVGLASEWQWMKRLQAQAPHIGHVPIPLAHPLIHIEELSHGEYGMPTPVATAYLTHGGYYAYPNEPKSPMGTPDAILAIGKAASGFAHLASLGLMHTAAVPLFHNRVQAARRDDDGIYLWQKGGRLDRWLESCRYPNFSSSGLRDFEHMKRTPEMISGEFYRLMGDQVLSLLLAAGSHFRSLGGTAAFPPFSRGDETDFRALFSQDQFREMLCTIVSGYHEGFSGLPCPELFQGLIDEMVPLLTEKMGRDTDMEEILRARDQVPMSHKDFSTFLASRRLSPEEIAAHTKDEKDIALYTGPHLGRFNRKISCPELLEFTATVASITIINGFRMGSRPSKAA